MRQVVAQDMASHYVMAFEVEPEMPTTLRSSRLIPFLDRVCRERGNPRKGIVISHSCWYSSLELELDDDTREQGEFLKALNIEFPPMPDTDKAELRTWAKARGLDMLFDADMVVMGK